MPLPSWTFDSLLEMGRLRPKLRCQGAEHRLDNMGVFKYMFLLYQRPPRLFYGCRKSSGSLRTRTRPSREERGRTSEACVTFVDEQLSVALQEVTDSCTKLRPSTTKGSRDCREGASLRVISHLFITSSSPPLLRGETPHSFAPPSSCVEGCNLSFLEVRAKRCRLSQGGQSQARPVGRRQERARPGADQEEAHRLVKQFEVKQRRQVCLCDLARNMTRTYVLVFT